MFVGVDEAVSAGGGMRPPSVKAPSMTNVMSDIGAGSSPAAEQQQVRTARGKYISDLNVHSRDGLIIFTIASLKREKISDICCSYWNLYNIREYTNKISDKYLNGMASKFKIV